MFSLLVISLFLAPGLFQCNFDTDICGWAQSKSDNFDWKRQSGKTGSVNTGPDSDHTSGGSY